MIRGLADEEIKRKVLAMAEPDCQLEKVVRFIEAEESGKYSLSDSKMFESVAGISSFKQQQRERERPAQPPKPPQPVQPAGGPRIVALSTCLSEKVELVQPIS